ncbi:MULTISPECIES: GPMC system transcriptional regulator [Geobacter]|uniref:GPMC system transcriptional regulator n=1 Tax=Geobacter TaxID=28231 RepID=UPI002572FDF6|nr:GPMC system transcriptional regulator [Geobacter sulfurreducens]BEH09578.1 GPMC system transcriptional regulator [Geobacter sulfurreducens subsp. ethanolicus]BET57460.1 GPMC system transcriptional regulator [Geobacter sp. 60473]
MESLSSHLPLLRDQIVAYGKENLEEMLHLLAEGVRLVSGQDRIRIYLEDLTRGVLTCVHASGPLADEIREVSFPIISREASVSSVFVSQYAAEFHYEPEGKHTFDRGFAERFAIGHSYILPVVSQGKSIGVVCIDRFRPGEILRGKGKALLGEFVTSVADRLDVARIYHQQLLLARRVEEYKKREAASFMVQSAVRLIDRLVLASVLVPVPGPEGSSRLAILASHSEDPSLKKQYDEQGEIALQRGTSLISRFLDDNAVIADERLLRPLFIPDLTQQELQKKALTEKMALRSLYVVPRYEPSSRKVICLVNYFTKDLYRFSDFEMGLLQTHAEMAERMVNEIGGEHLEIRVLAEITELLQERNEELSPFLTRVLSMATELIGADTGSIAIVQERDGEKWLVVEDEEGTIVGAKNKSWLKKYIPPFRIGGHELPPEERSLTGYVAWSKQPKIIAHVADEQGGEGFHRSMHELIKSEIAVPIVCDDEVIAVVCLNSLKPAWFTEEHKRILQIIDRLTSRHISDVQRIERLEGEVTRLKTDVAYKDPQISSYRLGNIIGNSRKAQEIVDFINTVSVPLFNRITLWSKNVLQEATIGLPSILVQGQTGAGKEFFFNNLYNKLNEMYREKLNPAGQLPVKKTNIAAYSGDLTYSELFGHKKGAFTGAYSDRKGILEDAAGGIVFLDEIGDADPKTQVQLLRFLDNGGFVRLGENQDRFSRVLLVAATNKDLAEEIRKGNFREDLYHRLSELAVQVPSLNERREDIPDLATHFLGKLYRTYRGDESKDAAPTLAEEAKRLLMNHHYHGNIRELRSILLRALFFRKGTVLTADDVRRALAAGMREFAPATATQELNDRMVTEILDKIANGETFWEAVYEPYSRNAIPRDAVRLVIERSRDAAGRSMPQVARYLKAVGDDVEENDEERKRFFKFKNFLYKTVKI